MYKYKLVFTIEESMSLEEIDTLRKQNRNFLTHGFFSKDENVARIAAYNKALNLLRTKPEMVNYESIKMEDE